MGKIRQNRNKMDRIKALDMRMSIMIEILMIILKCNYSCAYNIIISSKTYKCLVDGEYAILYDSPQANLSDIGKELREKKNKIGFMITDDNIVKAMYVLREQHRSNVERSK